MAKVQAIAVPPQLNRIAYDALRDAIVNGRFKPGEIYSEVNLAAEFGISRTPVREAVLELAAKGFVEVLPRKGVQITKFSSSDVAEIFEIRLAIESFMVRQVVRRADTLDMAPVRHALADQQAALDKADMLAFMRADRHFHMAFCELIGNRRMTAILENLRDMVQIMGLGALGVAGRAEMVMAEHRQILEIVEAARPHEAARALERHLTLSKEAALAALAQEPVETGDN